MDEEVVERNYPYDDFCKAFGIINHSSEIKRDVKRYFLVEEDDEVRNDVCIYKTLRYPPKSKTPTTD